jgi:hypothetical protein
VFIAEWPEAFAVDVVGRLVGRHAPPIAPEGVTLLGTLTGPLSGAGAVAI